LLGSGGLKAIDFAAGSVVHETAGFAALATVLYLGPRRQRVAHPHNIRWCCSPPESCGSGGSASTQEAPSRPARWPHQLW
jgi:hypothetical protein